MPALEIGCFSCSFCEVTFKLPVVHPALPRNAAGVVFWSGGKVTLVGQSGNLDHVTLASKLMTMESSSRNPDLEVRNALVGYVIMLSHLGTALLGGHGVGFSVGISETQAVGFWPRSSRRFRSKNTRQGVGRKLLTHL